jgi:hypothetical protein
VKFECYFEDVTLQEKVEPWLDYLPSVFEISVKEGKPELEYPWPADPNWNDFPFPKKENTLYIFWGDGLKSKSAGGGGGLKASLKVWKKDLLSPYDREKVALRIWHELLHAIGQPADDMSKVMWLDGSKQCWALDAIMKRVDRNYWQRQYYMYLIRNLIEKK